MANIAKLPTEPSSLEWLPRLRRGLRRLTEDGLKSTFLPAELLPSMSQRRELEGRWATIRERLAPGPDDERRKGVALARMWLVFPAQQTSEDEARERSKLYLQALSAFAAWPVEAACERWLKGDAQAVLGPVSYAFAPSPPQLALLAKDCAAALTTEAEGYQEILEAKTDRGPETPDELATRAGFIDGLKAKHGDHFGLGAKSEIKAETEAEVRRRMIEASDKSRARDFAAYGLPSPSAGSLEPSPALLIAMGARVNEDTEAQSEAA